MGSIFHGRFPDLGTQILSVPKIDIAWPFECGHPKSETNGPFLPRVRDSIWGGISVRLLRRPTAIDNNICPGQKAGRLRAQVQRELTNLFHSAPTADRDFQKKLLV